MENGRAAENPLGKLCWGFTAEWDLLPDLDDFVGDVAASFRELCDVPAVQAA